ncbi:hypothetical protein CRG98_002358 [Punica granatum]|uniref:Uncharacterized protein n=1 Tax=Punica granatum TaxID=22663 RepID=A0A2I0L957_PUNGR|nr:hypothetical protein CRG98_002358 [Punica granatum]
MGQEGLDHFLKGLAERPLYPLGSQGSPLPDFEHFPHATHIKHNNELSYGLLCCCGCNGRFSRVPTYKIRKEEEERKKEVWLAMVRVMGPTSEFGESGRLGSQSVAHWIFVTRMDGPLSMLDLWGTPKALYMVALLCHLVDPVDPIMISNSGLPGHL